MLIRKKILYPSRLLGIFYVLAIDGTGTVTYSRRHCPYCLTRTHGNTTTYYHSVLEAKLVTPHGFCFSIMSEFIENPGENPTKQDCELKAFYRLAERLHARFPRLPIALALDGLFAAGSVFDICSQYEWAFVVTLKDKDLPSVQQEFSALRKLQPQNKLRRITREKAEIIQDFLWVDDIDYRDSANRSHTLSVLECTESTATKNGTPTLTTFKWVTNLRVTAANVVELASNGGRIRWKVENEGFNVQKNGGFGLEHAYSNNPTSAKAFYFLLQVAHVIDQLIHRGSLLNQIFPKGFGSGRNLAFRLLEAWRNASLSIEFFSALAVVNGRAN